MKLDGASGMATEEGRGEYKVGDEFGRLHHRRFGGARGDGAVRDDVEMMVRFSATDLFQRRDEKI